jgi:Mg-chelatase subunit ChlD
MFPDTKFDAVQVDKQAGIADTVEEVSGKLKRNPTDEEKLMHSVLESDEQSLENGKLLADSITQGIGGFVPDLIFENLVRDFKLAEQLYGEVIIKELTSYSSDYVKKNIQIPEFKKELKKRVEDKIDQLKREKLLDKEGNLTDQGLFLSSLVLYVEELDHLIPKGFGEKEKKELAHYGEIIAIADYKKSRYRDIAIKASIKRAIRRNHKELSKQDLKIVERESHGKIALVYAIDASGSMRGPKLKTAKKAGIALSFKAVNEKNKVGLIVFGSEIKQEIPPTLDFMTILKCLANITASKETDIKQTILKSIDLFPKSETKHLVLLTDALPTKGFNPHQETLKAVSLARSNDITLSVIGINLDKEGLELAKKMVEIGNGRLYMVNNLENVDAIILEDYNKLKA